MPGNDFSGLLVIDALLIEAIEEVKDSGWFQSRRMRIHKALDGGDSHDRVQVRQERNEDYGTHIEYCGKQAPAQWAQVENGALRAAHEGLDFAVQPLACHVVGGNRLDNGGVHARGAEIRAGEQELATDRYAEARRGD